MAPGARSSVSPLDRWIRARLHELIGEANAALADYDLPRFAKAAEVFVDDLSNWYVRRSRRRFWKSEGDADKQAAYSTLYEVLVNLAKMLAPVLPFMAEATVSESGAIGGRECAGIDPSLRVSAGR